MGNIQWILDILHGKYNNMNQSNGIIRSAKKMWPGQALGLSDKHITKG